MRKKQLLIFLASFLVLRILLFNINVAEWGDSYDFLRIAEHLTYGQYPLDAKRLPIFPLLIAVGMPFMDAVIWAKIVVLLASAGCLFLTYKLTKRLFPNLSESLLLVTCFLLLFSPIFLYWSFRVVAEPVFAFWVLLAFNLYYTNWHESRREFTRMISLGAVSGLAAMTRYEGFLLFGAIGLGLLIGKIRKVSGVRRVGEFLKKGKLAAVGCQLSAVLCPIILYSLFFILIISPWFIRNYLAFGKIFHTPYTSDPAGFIKGAYYRWQWLFYTLFMFGFPFGFYALLCGLWEKRQRWFRYLPLYLFISSSLLLFFVWYPRARFYLYLIPLFLPFVVVGLQKISNFGNWKHSLVVLAPLILYFVGVWKFHFYFLGPGKVVKATVLGVGLLAGLVILIPLAKLAREKAGLLKIPQSLALGNRQRLVSLALVSEIAVSFGVISNHRLIYSSVYQATHDPLIAAKKVAYYDETGVTAWYLRKNGVYYDQDLSTAEQLDWLTDRQVNYVLWTNEHNEGAELKVITDSEFAKHFELVNEYSYPVGSTEFTSRLYEFKL